jgi:hypothetical protein
MVMLANSPIFSKKLHRTFFPHFYSQTGDDDKCANNLFSSISKEKKFIEEEKCAKEKISCFYAVI